MPAIAEDEASGDHREQQESGRKVDRALLDQGLDDIPLELLDGDEQERGPQRLVRPGGEGEQDRRNRRDDRPDERHELEQRGEQGEGQRRGHADQDEAEPGQHSDRDHRDQPAEQPEAERPPACVERLGGELAAARRDQLQKAGAVEIGLGGEVDSADDHQKRVGDSASDRAGDRSDMADNSVACGKARGPLPHRLADAEPVQPRHRRRPGSGDHRSQPLGLANHLGAEGPGGGPDQQNDEEDRAEQREGRRKAGALAERRGDQAQDHRDQNRSEDEDEEAAQVPQQKRDSDHDQGDHQPLDEDSVADRLPAHRMLLQTSGGESSFGAVGGGAATSGISAGTGGGAFGSVGAARLRIDRIAGALRLIGLRQRHRRGRRRARRGCRAPRP